jgi:hypothetical protein
MKQQKKTLFSRILIFGSKGKQELIKFGLTEFLGFIFSITSDEIILAVSFQLSVNANFGMLL